MSSPSENNVPPAIERENRFFRLLADLDNYKLVDAFLTAFLTESEVKTLAKRLEILQMLHAGHSYQEIQDELKVSSATVSSVSSYQDLPVTRVILAKMGMIPWHQRVLDRLKTALPFFNRSE